MKQWLRILLVIWCLGVISAGEKRSSGPSRAEISATAPSPGGEHITECDQMPLLATSSSPAATACGSELPLSGKGGRQQAGAAALHAGGGPGHTHLVTDGFITRHIVSVPNIRTTTRYIYYLRRIII